MTAEELELLILREELKKLSFNNDEFEIEFANGVSVTVGITTEWDCAVWDIESNIERQQNIIRWEKEKQEREEKQKLLKMAQSEILSKFPQEQWEQIMKMFK